MKKVTQRGFTLIELMLSISIIILTASMMVPMMSSMIGDDQTEGTCRQISGYLMMARQQAMQFNRDTAVSFQPPTAICPNSRLMIFQLKDDATNPPAQADWLVMAGSYGLKLPKNFKVTNKTDDASFYIYFNARGTISPRCPADNLTLRVGPINLESREPILSYRINRTTGTFLRLKPGAGYMYQD